MPAIEYDGAGFHVEITSSAPIRLASAEFRAFVKAKDDLDALFPMISIDVAVAGSDYSYALVADAGTRTYSATLRPTAHQRKITSTSFWTLPELLVHNPMIEAVFGLLDLGVTKIEVDWS